MLLTYTVIEYRENHGKDNYHIYDWMGVFKQENRKWTFQFIYT